MPLLLFLDPNASLGAAKKTVLLFFSAALPEFPWRAGVDPSEFSFPLGGSGSFTFFFEITTGAGASALHPALGNFPASPGGGPLVATANLPPPARNGPVFFRSSLARKGAHTRFVRSYGYLNIRALYLYGFGENPPANTSYLFLQSFSKALSCRLYRVLVHCFGLTFSDRVGPELGDN